MYGVLIVDDEPMICEGLKLIVQWTQYGFGDIRIAYDGEAALTVIEEQKPHLLITDIHMPKMDGVELLQQIRKLELDMRVIVLSGYGDFEYVRAMAVLGIENYLLKPINEAELNATVQNVSKRLMKEQELKVRTLLDINLIKANIINRWIYGTIGESELEDRAEFLNLNMKSTYYQPCIMKVLGEDAGKNIQLKNDVYKICNPILSTFKDCYYTQNYEGDTIVVFCYEELENNQNNSAVVINQCFHETEKHLYTKLYVLLGETVTNYWSVGKSFRTAHGNGLYIDMVPENIAETDELRKGREGNQSPFSMHLAQYVLDNYSKDLSLKTLAVHFKGNAAYIGQCFKRDIGKPFSDYLKGVRIEKAKELLVNRNYSAKEVAGRVGFQNVTYFCAIFKKETGMSPVEYKKYFIRSKAL